MSYQVLARKLRPATFDALVGQEHVVRALSHALDQGRLHHAYLFTGTRGVGKTTIARVLAKALNCEQGVSANPCGECSVCREVAENRFVDLIEVDAASRTRVDDTRELLENAQYLPTRGRYKVYLVDEVHMLSAASFNALLKTLEEPPEHVKFLLATTDPKKVPVTVLSRCLQFQLKNLSASRISTYLADVLAGEGIGAEAEALELIGRAARGSMRDALSITDQAIGYGQGELRAADVVDMLGLVGRDQVGGLLDALAGGDAARVLAVTEELSERAVDFQHLLAELLAELHAMAVSHALESAAAVPFDAETVQLYYQIALHGHRDLSFAPDPRQGVEMTLLRMLAFTPEEGSRVPRSEAARPGAAAAESAGADAAGADTASADAASADAANADAAGADAGRADAAPGDYAAESAVATDLPAEAPPGSLQADWYELVAALDLAGVARMIAEHTELRCRDGDRFELILDHAHDTLLSDTQVEVIRRALGRHLAADGDGARKPTVQLVPGPVLLETPAARNARLAAERQRAAEQAMAADPTVRALIEDFGGSLAEVEALPAQDAPAAATQRNASAAPARDARRQEVR